MQVFISHAHKDRVFAKKLAEDLERAGFRVWYSEWEMRPGDSFVKKIAGGIVTSGYMIVVLSPNSVNSRWVEKELSLALANQLADKDIKIVPILHKTCEFPSTFHALGDILYADFRKEYDSAFHKLLKGLGLSSDRRGIEQFQGNIDDLRVVTEISSNTEVLSAYTLMLFEQSLTGNSWRYNRSDETVTLHLESSFETSSAVLQIRITNQEAPIMRSVTTRLGWGYHDLIEPIQDFVSLIQISFHSNAPTFPTGIIWLLDEEWRALLRKNCDEFVGLDDPLFCDPYDYPSETVKTIRDEEKRKTRSKKTKRIAPPPRKRGG